MRRVLLGAVCVLALSAGAAAAEVNGYVGGSWARTNIEVGPGEADVDTWTGEGKFTMPVGPLEAQVDASLSSYDFGDLGGDDVTVFAPTVHLYKRSEAGAIGGFVGWQHTEDLDLWGVGAEGQLYLDRVTIDGALAWGTVDDADVDIWSTSVNGRFFATDNLRLDGGLSLTKFDGGGGELDLFTASVGGEWKLDNAPVSFTAGLERSTLEDFVPGFDLEADTFRLGVRFNFGGGATFGSSSLMATGTGGGGDTLLDRDRNGASQGSVGERFGGSLGQGFLGLVSMDFEDEEETD